MARGACNCGLKDQGAAFSNFPKSCCPLIWGWGLWPSFVAPAFCKSTFSPPSSPPLLLGSLPLFTAVCWSGQVASPQDFKAVGRAYRLYGLGICTKVPLATSRQESLTSVPCHVNPCPPLLPRHMNEMLTSLYSAQPEKAQLLSDGPIDFMNMAAGERKCLVTQEALFLCPCELVGSLSGHSRGHCSPSCSLITHNIKVAHDKLSNRMY